MENQIISTAAKRGKEEANVKKILLFLRCTQSGFFFKIFGVLESVAQYCHPAIAWGARTIR